MKYFYSIEKVRKTFQQIHFGQFTFGNRIDQKGVHKTWILQEFHCVDYGDQLRNKVKLVDDVKHISSNISFMNQTKTNKNFQMKGFIVYMYLDINFHK